MLLIGNYKNFTDTMVSQGFWYVYDHECWYSERNGFISRRYIENVIRLKIKHKKAWQTLSVEQWANELENSDFMRIRYAQLRELQISGGILTPWKFMMRDTGGYRSLRPCEIRDYGYIGGMVR